MSETEKAGNKYKVMVRNNGMEIGDIVILDPAEEEAWAGEIDREFLVPYTDGAVDTVTDDIAPSGA